MNAELAEEQRQTQARLHTSWHDGLVLVLGQEPDADLVDGIRAIASPQVYLQLVEHDRLEPRAVPPLAGTHPVPPAGPHPRGDIVTTHTAPLDGPADIQTMGIVHSALRRDVVRAKMVLGTPAAREPRRRTAIAEHLIWMVDFLHHHHQGEDDGLYPLVVRRNPASAELVEQMDADHGIITPAMDALEAGRAPPPGRPGQPRRGAGHRRSTTSATCCSPTWPARSWR